jgi:hypothetical protein
MNEPRPVPEIPLYDQNGIKITNLRAVFGEKTYAVANITSVETVTLQPNGCLPAGLIIIGILMAMVGGLPYLSTGDGSLGMLVIGLLFAGGGIGIMRTSKPSYAVSLTTASGEVKAYTHEDLTVIRAMVEALNTAIVHKG